MKDNKEEIIKMVKEGIKKDVGLNFRFQRPRSKEDFYKSALKNLEYMILNKYRGMRMFPKRDQLYLEMVEEFGPELKSFIDETMMKTKKRMLQQEVNSTTAGILIDSLLKAEGISYKVEMQTYRAKIYVKLNDTNKAIFYINYKKMNEGLEKLVPAVRQMQEIVTTFGRNTGIEMIHKWENWD